MIFKTSPLFIDLLLVSTFMFDMAFLLAFANHSAPFYSNNDNPNLIVLEGNLPKVAHGPSIALFAPSKLSRISDETGFSLSRQPSFVRTKQLISDHPRPLSQEPGLVRRQKSQVSSEESLIRSIKNKNRLENVRFLNEFAMNLPRSASLNDLLWLSDHDLLPLATDVPRRKFRDADGIAIGETPASFLAQNNITGIRLTDHGSHKHMKFVNRYGMMVPQDIPAQDYRESSSLIEPEYASSQMHATKSYRNYRHHYHHHDDPHEIEPHTAASYHPHYHVVPVSGKSSSKRYSLEKIGTSILVGSLAALISFLIISNLFLSIPLLIMTLMQILNGQFSQPIQLPIQMPFSATQVTSSAASQKKFDETSKLTSTKATNRGRLRRRSLWTITDTDKSIQDKFARSLLLLAKVFDGQ